MEYENVPLYEEIPEYMNLPFHAGRLSLPHSRDSDIYEVQDPYLTALGDRYERYHKSWAIGDFYGFYVIEFWVFLFFLVQKEEKWRIGALFCRIIFVPPP